jgi:hypothetical protein
MQYSCSIPGRSALTKLLAFLASLAALPAAASPATAADPGRPALLVVGTPHFGNPGLDAANSAVPDVTASSHLREIEAVVASLAAFRPTHVAIEWPAAQQPDLDRLYADYRAGQHSLTADERQQIGFRLAARLDLARVHAIDWNDMPPGAESDYDYVAYAQAHAPKALRVHRRASQALAERETLLMACTPVSAWLRRVNGPETRLDMHRAYYRIARLGDAQRNPGAAWVGSWYARNLRILSNLVAIAPDPSGRIVAIYGAGHGYLLDQQARESGAFEVADTLSYLPRTSRDDLMRCGN